MAAEETRGDERLLHWPDVFKEELQQVNDRRGASADDESNLAGLAISGGGIRSATFNLGVIQALSRLRLLSRFDYLSTISGGGFIGGWLSMYIRRRAAGDVKVAEQQIGRRERGLEDGAIRFLRSFSNYLTPRVGFSSDTLTLVATYLRNLTLNLGVLITLLAAALVVPRIVVVGETELLAWSGLGDHYLEILLALLLPTTLIVALNLFYRPVSRSARPDWYVRSAALMALVDLPVVAASLLVTCYYIWVSAPEQMAAGLSLDFQVWMKSIVASYAGLWVIGVLLAVLSRRLFHMQSQQEFAGRKSMAQNARWLLTFAVSATAAGIVGGAALFGIASAIASLVESKHLLWAATVLGPPAVIISIMLMVVVHVGLMARKFTEGDREIWSVLGGRLLKVTVLWPIVFGIALYGAAAIGFANQWVAGAGGVAWIVSTLFGVFAGKSSATGKSGAAGKDDAKRWVEVATRFAPYVFVLGLLVVLSWGLHEVLARTDGKPPVSESAASGAEPSAGPGVYLHATPQADAPVVTVRNVDKAPSLWAQFLKQALEEYDRLKAWFEPVCALPAIMAALLAISVFLSFRININLFSLHHFYRNRITRCYLGATHADRRPNPLTGLDPQDDVRLAELAGQQPLHILGTAINLNRGKELAWQNRRAASFAFTPLHVGYEPASRVVDGGFRSAAEYGKDASGTPVELGTAIAISGAAASPNSGFHTSPAVAFLLTVFNVRLGHWCGNPTHRGAWRWRDPLFTLRYWLAELTGSADQGTPFVSLSDGGHFENLGVYELVRRGCSLILASDAGADPKFAFDDLAEAIRKCYTDFGVNILFDDPKLPVDDIRPESEEKPGKRHYSIGRIVYPDRAEGTLIYWKSSLTPDLPPDIMHYRRTHTEFPHEPTADQFFDESQFESYRHLGYEVAMRSIREMFDTRKLPQAWVAGLPPGAFQ